MKTTCDIPITKALDVCLSSLMQDEEKDTKMDAEELKNHENVNKSTNTNLDTDDGKNKKKKSNIDQCAGIVTEMFSTITMEVKHDKLTVLIEEQNVGNDEGCERRIKGLYSNTDSERNTLKNKLIKIMLTNVNEVHSDEEDMIQGENESLNYNQEVVRTCEEVNIKSTGSLKGFIESHL